MNKQLILTPELIKRAEELDKQLCSIGLAIENRLGEVLNLIASNFDVEITNLYFSDSRDVITYVDSECDYISVDEDIEIYSASRFERFYIYYHDKIVDLSEKFPTNFMFISDDEIKKIICDGKLAYKEYNEKKKAKEKENKQAKKEIDKKKLATILTKLSDDEKEFITKNLAKKTKVKL